MYLLGKTPALGIYKGKSLFKSVLLQILAWRHKKNNKETRTLKSAFLWKWMFESWSSAGEFCSRFKWQIDLCTYQEDRSPEKTFSVFCLLRYYAVWAGIYLHRFGTHNLYLQDRRRSQVNTVAYFLTLKMEAVRSPESSITRLHGVKFLKKKRSHDSRSHRTMWFKWYGSWHVFWRCLLRVSAGTLNLFCGPSGTGH